MDNVQISVLVPCYNVEKYVDQCIQSIINQKFRDLEIICINDGSTDSTLKILNKYKQLDNRIIIIDKKNSGYGASLNIGIQKSSGKYISIIESDDFIDSDMLYILYNNAEKFNLDVSRCCFKYFYNNKKIINEKFDFVQKDKILYPCNDTCVFFQMPSIWCGLYKKDLLIKNNIYFLETPGASYQDTAFIFKVYYCTQKYYQVKDCFVNYRQIEENSSNNKGKVFCVNKEWEEIYKFVKNSQDRYEKIKFLLPILQLATYRWNYLRIDNKLKKDFLNRWTQEWRDLYKNNILILKNNKFLKINLFEVLIILYCNFLYNSYVNFRSLIKSIIK